jgi:hypothetical protein
VTIPKTALTGTAGDKLSSVALPELRSADGESEGTLTWASPDTIAVRRDEPLRRDLYPGRHRYRPQRKNACWESWRMPT